MFHLFDVSLELLQYLLTSHCHTAEMRYPCHEV